LRKVLDGISIPQDSVDPVVLEAVGKLAKH
jgi:hypothetical protein